MRDIGYLFGVFIETFELLFDFVVWKKKVLELLCAIFYLILLIWANVSWFMWVN